MASPQIKFSLTSDPAQNAPGELLAIPLFEADLTEKSDEQALAQADNALGGLLLKAAAEEGFKAKAEQSCLLHTHGKLTVQRVLLLGMGNRAKFNPEVLRQTAGRAAKAASRLRAREVSFALPPVRDADAGVKAAVEGFGLGVYQFDRYKTQGKEKNAPKLSRVSLLLPAGHARSKALEEMISLGQKLVEATNWARDLVNEPGGEVTPVRLAEEARKAAQAHGLKISVGGWKEIRQLKMGMFIGVAQGSVHEPRLVKVSYVPKNQKHAKRPAVALVGKAITFDSGGLSLKTAEGMVDMKTDMAGSAAVLGAMQVVAALKPPFPIHAYLGACENMPSGTAYRPGDILISRLGKTVEITNTDAEGRLVLGDILAWANEEKPAVLIDIATLTGACMIALGHYVAGAFGDDDDLTYAVLEAARSAGEEMWRLPIAEAQKDALRSDVADMKNSGERYGGSINAAHFLKEFVGETPWVHLDIAGPSTSPKERGYHAKGATGYGVRTFVEYIRKRAQQVGA